MGGAASAKRKGAPQEHDARARWSQDKKGRGRQRGGGEAGEGDENLLKERLLQDPSRRRRRKVLFGGGGGEVPFDRVTPQEQFNEHPQDDDLVYRRCGGLEAFNAFRNKAQDVRYSKTYDNGFLEDNAIELLGLDLGETWLKTRLYKMAQVQEIKTAPPGEKPEPRPEKLTCYELLALHSVFRYGERSELLELLFCVSDADGDDRVSVADLTMFVTAFLGLPQGVDKDASQMDEQELQDFEKMGEKAIKSEAALIAKKAVKDFGSKTLDDGEAEDSEGLVSDEDSDTSVSSKKANPGGGKKPSGRRGLCQGKRPADTDTEDDESTRSRSKKASARKKDKKSKGGCLGGGGKSKGPPALNYEQWRKWLAQSDLLPPEWAEALDVTLATVDPVESSAAELKTSEVRTDPLDSALLDSASEGGDDSPTPRGHRASPPTDTRPLLTVPR